VCAAGIEADFSVLLRASLKKEKDCFEMRPTFRALFLTVSLSIALGALHSIHASAREQNPDRTPRMQGIEPDARTRTKLVEIVNRHALAAGVPAGLVRAVIRVESDWDINLTGHAGEIGLMQIRPETARDIGFKGADDELYDPETNIRWGVAYLAAGYKLANGDLCQTILKYNAGTEVSKMTEAASAYCGRVRNILASN
jgi:soluble lytic murein transglycosylase-like protein